MRRTVKAKGGRCLQEVRWRGEGARSFGVKGRRYKLRWCGNDYKIVGMGYW